MRKRSAALMMLLELAAMLLVFSLCSAVTIRLFSAAHTMTARSLRIGAAADLAQTAAECYRWDGDAEHAARELAAVWDADGYRAELVRDGEVFTVYLYPQEGKLRISVWVDGENLYEITVGAI